MKRDNIPEPRAVRDPQHSGEPASLPGPTSEHELLAGLLAYSKSRVSAGILLRDFPSIGHVVAAERPQLKMLGLTDEDIGLLRLVQATACHMAKATVRDRPTLSSSPALISYLQTAMGYEQVEYLRMLFLDCRNHLIADEILHRGSINHTPVYPREVMKRALILNASAIIAVHNHPSGDPSPSRDDIAMTRQLRAAAASLELELHDHIIIGHGKHASFRSLGLL